jgi:hypothetical protein
MKGRASASRQLRGWADYDAIPVTLIPHAKVRTNAGGWQEVAGPVRPVQICGVGLNTLNSTSTTGDGTTQTSAVSLVGEDLIVEVGDTFTYNGLAMVVTNVRRGIDGVVAEASADGR